MRFKEFITEASEEDIFNILAQEYNINSDTMNDIINISRKININVGTVEWIIKMAQQCQPYINEVGWDHAFGLYRGVRGTHDNLIQKRVRLEDRIPKTMDKTLFKYVNGYFTKMFGAPYRNSLLAIGDNAHARLFGEVYVIFPIGDFTYLWSPENKDLNFSYGNFLGTNIVQDDDTIKNTDDPKNTPILNDLFMKNVIETIDWKTTNLKEAIDSEVEIMIRCKSYYGISLDLKKLFPAIKEIMKLSL